MSERRSPLAATLETAARGVIYEHPPQSRVAQRLVSEMQAMMAEVKQQGATVYDREAAIVLRAIEQGAREARKAGGGNTAYLELILRLLQVNRAAETTPAPQAGSSLIRP